MLRHEPFHVRSDEAPRDRAAAQKPPNMLRLREKEWSALADDFRTFLTADIFQANSARSFGSPPQATRDRNAKIRNAAPLATPD